MVAFGFACGPNGGSVSGNVGLLPAHHGALPGNNHVVLYPRPDCSLGAANNCLFRHPSTPPPVAQLPRRRALLLPHDQFFRPLHSFILIGRGSSGAPS